MTGSSSRLSSRDLLSVLLVVVLWGLNFVPTKLALANYSPFQLGAARFILAAFPLVLMVPRPNIPVKWLLLYGFTQGVGQYSLLFFALKVGMPAGLTSVLMQTQIFFTAIMAATLLGETVSRALKIGMAVAGVGLVCFGYSALSQGGGAEVSGFGLLLTLSAALMWASSNIVVRKIQGLGNNYSALSLVSWSGLVSAVVFTLLAAVVENRETYWRWVDAPLTVWLSVFYLGWVGNAFTFWLWTKLLNRYPANSVAPFSLLIPIVGLTGSILILNEQVTRLQWLGSGLVMSSLVLVVVSSRLTIEKMSRRYGRG